MATISAVGSKEVRSRSAGARRLAFCLFVLAVILIPFALFGESIDILPE
jgi:hypothetical protein